MPVPYSWTDSYRMDHSCQNSGRKQEMLPLVILDKRGVEGVQAGPFREWQQLTLQANLPRETTLALLM